MRHNLIRQMTALVLLPLLAGVTQAASEKPNILVIWGDDIGWSNLSAYHRGMLGGRTPQHRSNCQ